MKQKSILEMLAAVCVLSVGCSMHSDPDGDSRYQAFAPDGIPFQVADSIWPVDLRGNHRAVVTVADTHADGVIADLPWRRPDLRIETKKVLVTDSRNNEVKDVVVTRMSSESGQIIFRPISGENRYYIYYLPYKWRHGYGDARSGKPWNDYLEPVSEADEVWAAEVAARKSSLPFARVNRFESRSRFDFWSPMGVVATAEEMSAVREMCGKDMIVFPEDRAFPIQLSSQLPARWAGGPSSKFTGHAMRNEYYTWQLGIWAAGRELKNVRVSFSDLRNGRSVIGADSITCFNQEGTDWNGARVEFSVNVPERKVQALWCGVQIPGNAKAGSYSGKATICADGVEPQSVDLTINVSSKVLADKGDAELWRHARLRWLNSTIALDNEPVGPYLEMNLEGTRVEATGKFVTVGGNGMVEAIRIHDKNVLEKPQQIVVSTGGRDIVFSADNLNIQKKAAGLVAWTASSCQDGIIFKLDGNMEFDGHLHFNIFLSSEEDIQVQGVRLVTTYSPYASEYFMGCGFPGGCRPERYSWDWTGPYDSYWMGGVSAGLHTEFRGGTYHGPLLYDYMPEPAPVWSNGGLGRVAVEGVKKHASTVTASTGATTLSRKPKNYEFNLLITPVKELAPSKHFSERYYHSDPAGFDKAAEDGANIANIHHAQNLNPYINYPFIVRDPLIAFIRHEHGQGRKVKLYYTIRELTTHCEEVYAFKSLDHEIFLGGAGYGLPWECEHLVDDYKPAWYTSLSDLKDGDSDAALVLRGNSRFINYYLEGLRWMVENYDLDGIYLDDVSYDRITVKRIRKILDRYHDGSLIDLHSNTRYSVGPANQYTEFFPYVDRLWFGENFKYDRMTPDEWLVTFSGIPFGEMSEMLQNGGNRFLGMVYGATARHSWTETSGVKSPVPMWRFWDAFGIQDAKMLGWWAEDCPVSVSDPEVKATAYAKKDSVLVSIGNFSGRDKKIRLDVDYRKLGIDPAKAKIEAPAIENFQPATVFKDGESIPVKSKEGWLILISRQAEVSKRLGVGKK